MIKEILFHGLFYGISKDPTTSRTRPASWHPPRRTALPVHYLAIIYSTSSRNTYRRKIQNGVVVDTGDRALESHGYIVIQWHVCIYTSRMPKLHVPAGSGGHG